ncbi:Protein grainyhead [Portunus trituberculatus]|uniref:Protein grainyhead n=1 Tax=Portunus trituberculatus TaxID=210409 RepID=A0A5B7FFR5_PORTR|nr:Protein grainyhead [Portunus trituberculatus]
MVMLVFREEKTQEDEIKAWQFWHSRQHSVKQRILDVDRSFLPGAAQGVVLLRDGRQHVSVDISGSRLTQGTGLGKGRAPSLPSLYSPSAASGIRSYSQFLGDVALFKVNARRHHCLKFVPETM